jgi:hypothetical protein
MLFRNDLRSWEIMIIHRPKTNCLRSVPPTHGRKPLATAGQHAAAEAVFVRHTDVLRPPPPSPAVARDLVPHQGSGFQPRSGQCQTRSQPSRGESAQRPAAAATRLVTGGANRTPASACADRAWTTGSEGASR